jgi:phosphatidate cytidylyltransferase
MAPEISPNKTWEGAVAGLIAGGGIGAWILLGPLREAFRSPAWALVVMAVVVTIAAQMGDLVKSAIKRWAGVKDSGRLLPEFGGALDMIDSFLISGPVAWIVVQILR